MVNRFMTERFEVLTQWLPLPTATPLVFSTNPLKDTFSLKNFSQSSPRIPAHAGVEDKTISIMPVAEKKTLWRFFTMRSSSSCQTIFLCSVRDTCLEIAVYRVVVSLNPKFVYI